MAKFDDRKVIGLSENEVNELIDSYQPFVVKVISELKHSYVDASSDEFSIGLSAFHEAIKKYQLEKGSFLSFARLVIESRVKNYWSSEYRHQHTDIDEMKEFASFNEQNDLKLEIIAFESKLSEFNLTFDDLVDASPTHQKTRTRSLNIGIKSSKDKEVVDFLYLKKRLPITMISEKQNVTVKIVKGNKIFITSVIIVFKEKLEEIIKSIL